jgi:hypothetical protein
MSNYKLIKEYPGSPEVGTIAKESSPKSGSIAYTLPSGVQYVESSANNNLFKQNIENHPEYWERQNFEILQYVQKDKLSYSSKRRGGKDHEKYWNIFSVSRISDGEIFSIGNSITGATYKDARVIEEIILDGEGDILFGQGKGYTELVDAVKCKSPLFLTNDGVDVFVGDIIHVVDSSLNGIDRIMVANFRPEDYPTFKVFSTKKAAEDYIVKNKYALSIEDFWNVVNMPTSNFNKSTHMKQLVRERLGL